jgi:thiol:disulfide interchange protein DsbC
VRFSPSLISLAAVLAMAPAFADTAEKTVRAALMKSFPDIEISDVRASPVPGMVEVSIGANIAYATSDGKYLFTGDLLDLSSRVNLTESTRQRVTKKAIDAVSEKNMIVIAPKDVKHTITVFTDVDCGYCRKLNRDVPELNNSGIKVRYLFFPRAGIDSETYKTSVSVWCAKDRVKAINTAKAGGKVEAKTCPNPVKDHFELGQRLGVSGTPVIVLENGQMLPGYLPPDKLLQAASTATARSAKVSN